jgi:hypothetical protein
MQVKSYKTSNLNLFSLFVFSFICSTVISSAQSHGSHLNSATSTAMPTCIAPANVTITCEAFDPTLVAHGSAQVDPSTCVDSIREVRNDQFFDTICNRGFLTRTFTVFDCAGQTGTCSQRITVSYNQDYFLHLPQDWLVNDCPAPGGYGQPIIFNEDCEIPIVSYLDVVTNIPPDVCYRITRSWKITNWCTYDPSLPCVQIPNPNPNALSNHPNNLNAPVLKVTPFAATDLSVPMDMRSTLVSIVPGAPETDYSTFWQANANCYEYHQLIKVNDIQRPIIDSCSSGLVPVYGDVTKNDVNIWNDSLFFDPIHNQNDVCESPIDQKIAFSDACAGTTGNVRYLLYLDTDNNGDMETVINSANPPAPGFVNKGNAGNINFTGGTPVRFDERPVPTNDLWRFGVQTVQIANGKRTVRIAFNTVDDPNVFVLPQLPHGNHRIKWFVADHCGNEATCERAIVIKDTKPPIVVCINSIAVNILPSGLSTIWTDDLLQYTVDNCTPDGQMALSDKTAICKSCTSFPFDVTGNPIKNVSFDCTDLGTRIVRIWSRDAIGNEAFCEAYVLVQDNGSNCPNTPQPITHGTINGKNNNNITKPIKDVLVNIYVPPTLNTPGLNTSALTNMDGMFSFNFVLPVANTSIVTVTPSKDADSYYGVDMLDVLKIQRHILGQEPLPTVYRQIAADANNSRSITSSDIITIRKLVLGSIVQWPNIRDWRFVPKSHQFPNPNNVFSAVFPENILFTPGITLPNFDFEAIKVGDVNGDGIGFLVKNDDRTPIHLDVQDQEVQNGLEYTVQFKPEAMDALQFTLQLDDLEVVSTDLEDTYFALHHHAITLAMEQVKPFSITFKAKGAGRLSKKLSMSSSITRAMAYRNEIATPIDLRFDLGATPTTTFTLYQNTPNPFTESTTIRFDMQKANRATLTINDELGRTIYSNTADYHPGSYTIGLNKETLNSKGILFYTLTTEHESKTMRMIVLD